MDQFVCSENIQLWMDNKSLNLEQNRKHVRFETPPKPMPFIEKTPLPQYNMLNIFGQTHQDSNKLDLSILDMETIPQMSPMGFEFNEPTQNNKYVSSQVSPINKLLTENDFPQTLNMTKTPAPNLYIPNQSGNVYEISDERITNISQSTKFNVNKKIDDNGFFTLPNSSSKFSMENNLQTSKENINNKENHPRQKEKQSIEKQKRRELINRTNLINPNQCHRVITQNIPQHCHCAMNVCQNYMQSQPTIIPNNIIATKPRDDSEPSVSDLYNIIKIQNEQIQNLRSSVDQLLKIKETDEKNQSSNTNSENKTNLTDSNMHKMSIGVMTSFEVVMTSQSKNTKYNYVDECIQTSHIKNSETITSRVFAEENFQQAARQMNFLDGIKHYNQNEENCNNSKNINQPTLRKNRHTKNDDLDIDCVKTDSLMMKLQNLKSPPISPQSPVNLDFEDYSDSEDECSRPGVGWTFYNNCMNHVNQILSSPPEVTDAKYPTKRSQNNKITVNRLKRMGFGSNDNNTSKKVTFEACNVQQSTTRERLTTETSVQMNNLAAKYLNNVSDERFAYKTPTIKKNIQNPNYAEGLRNDMSFSTHQYMQKHHLLSNTHDDVIPRYYRKEKSPQQRFELPGYVKPSRILDITAIKQQPKLL